MASAATAQTLIYSALPIYIPVGTLKTKSTQLEKNNNTQATVRRCLRRVANAQYSTQPE